jgi:hypothetical protein
MAKKTVAKKAEKKAVSKKCSCEGMESLIVASKDKAYIKSKGAMTASDSLAALSCRVYCLLDKAIERTLANRRSTVKPQDL